MHHVPARSRNAPPTSSFFWGCIIAGFLAACAAVGLAPAQSFDQQLAYAYGTHTAVLDLTNQALQAGKLTPAEARQVSTIADNARSILDSAKAVETSDLATATGRLTLASKLLDQLQTYLQTRGK
jgi:hypothetical protein